MLSSILHRVTGVGLYIGALGLGVWLLTLSMGPEAFGPIDAFLHTIIGEIGLYLLAAALGFHLFNGVRHLLFDAGIGFKPASANLSAWIALSGLVIAPLAIWLVLHFRG